MPFLFYLPIIMMAGLWDVASRNLPNAAYWQNLQGGKSRE